MTGGYLSLPRGIHVTFHRWVTNKHVAIHACVVGHTPQAEVLGGDLAEGRHLWLIAVDWFTCRAGVGLKKTLPVLKYAVLLTTNFAKNSVLFLFLSFNKKSYYFNLLFWRAFLFNFASWLIMMMN